MAKGEADAPHGGAQAHGDGCARARADDPDALPRIALSDTLLGGASHLAILHNETPYFLRQTRFGKLILTK